MEPQEEQQGARPLRVYLADASERILANVGARLSREPDVDLVGSSSDGAQALRDLLRLQPDVAILDAALPTAEGMEVAEALRTRLPRCGVILLSLEVESDAYRQAMVMGIREFLAKPFRGDELVAAIRRVHAFQTRASSPHHAAPVPSQTARPRAHPSSGSIFTVIGSKGGVGKTLTAVSLATHLAIASQRPVVMVDLSLQLSDLAAMLNVAPGTAGIVELARANAAGEAEAVAGVLAPGPEALRVLVGPSSPEQADFVTASHVRSLLEVLRSLAAFVVVDTSGYLTEAVLEAIDAATTIVQVTDYSILALKNVVLIGGTLHAMSIDPSRVALVANSPRPEADFTRATAEAHLHRDIVADLPYSPDLVRQSMTDGFPIPSTHPGSAYVHEVATLAARLTPSITVPQVPAAQADPSPRRGRLFGLGRG